MTGKLKNAALPAGIVIGYCAVRFLLEKQLNELGAYGTYVFEAVFVSAVILGFYRKRFKLALKIGKGLTLQLLFAAPLGWMTYKTAGMLNYPIPFDFTDKELLVFLLLIGPVLEELIFRQALWFPCEDLFKKPGAAVAATTLLFSFGHFYAYFGVPPELKSFVLYQTCYTLLIGAWWGLAYSRTRAIGIVIALHMLFNAGFWAGSLAS